MFDLEVFKDRKVSNFIHPFKKDCIDQIEIKMGKGWLSGKIEYTGKITFRRGGTTGWERIEGNSFNDVVEKVEQFINNL